jgi:hypothetical protein
MGLHPHTLLSACTICSPRPLSVTQSGCRGAGASSLASMTASMTSPVRGSRHSRSTPLSAAPDGRAPDSPAPAVPAAFSAGSGVTALRFPVSVRWLAQADRARARGYPFVPRECGALPRRPWPAVPRVPC